MPFAVVATDQPQLQAAHVAMLGWCQQMIEQCRRDHHEAMEAYDQANLSRWDTRPFSRQKKLLEKRITFYEKIEAAIKAGYVIVPNFGLTLFAVRTTREEPSVGAKSKHSNFDEPSQMLPQGDGEYQNPEPLGRHYEVTRRSGQGEHAVTMFKPTDFQDVAFPVALAKPTLMAATREAMQLKVFDEIGVADDWDHGKKGDPVVIGRIRNPRRGRPDVAFFIGWHFDPSRL